ncbi:protein kinase C-binding protein NELL2 [Nematostella vectensis]|uniref:protein kinase C-binding protein NELL2 n=1 Tax=Nematostella vectensis TaxID=45351 RepID=UPI0020771944|nr:protein kinase C-binding protein NELL2 [Nematostella vectensis]
MAVLARNAVLLLLIIVSWTKANDLPKEINLFTEVGLPNALPTGVSSAVGHHSNTPAYRFSDQTGHLISGQSGMDAARRVIETSHDFIVSAWCKVNEMSRFGKNTIISISSDNGQQLFFFFAVSSDWQTSRLNIEFTFISSKGSMETIKVTTRRSVDFKTWHKVSMRVQDQEKLIRFYLDDEMVDVRKFGYSFSVLPSNAQLRLAQVYEILMEGTAEIGQRFKGNLQDVKIILGISQGACPTPSMSPCQCPSVGGDGCTMDGRGYANGQQWTKDQCNTCQCKKGNVFCVHTCPVCKDGDKVRLHGDKWHPSNDSCSSCRCEMGKITCSPPVCPQPMCASKHTPDRTPYSGETVTLPGTCCPICKEDQCKPIGKEYNKCGCARTCQNHHLRDPCDGQCSEGCFCPRGLVMNEDGKCGSPSTCKCSYKGRVFKPGQFYSATPCKFCICLMGYMHCNSLC